MPPSRRRPARRMGWLEVPQACIITPGKGDGRAFFRNEKVRAADCRAVVAQLD